MGFFSNKRAKYTEEQLRNLKIDVKKIQQWEQELNSLLKDFEEFSPSRIRGAIDVFLEADNILSFGIRYEDRDKAKQWMKEIDLHKLMWIANDNAAPKFMRDGLKFKFSDWLKEKIKKQKEYISSLERMGTSNSIIIRLATSKVDPQTLFSEQAILEKYQLYIPRVTKVDESIALINQLKEVSDRNLDKIIKVEEKLKLAKAKLGALESFERKHGKAFAKAAAAEQRTRQRAASIRKMVKKTQECPYCLEKLNEDAHLDHIYPVSKGGLSIIENLIWCCATCNSIKSDKGLIQFLNERGCSVTQTLDRLQALGKHV